VQHHSYSQLNDVQYVQVINLHVLRLFCDFLGRPAPPPLVHFGWVMIDGFDPRQLRDSERLIHVSFKSRTVFNCTCSTPQTAEIHKNPFCPQLRKSITKHLVVSTATHLEDSNSTTPAPWTSRLNDIWSWIKMNQVLDGKTSQHTPHNLLFPLYVCSSKW
jgi:hypothetical protein